MNSKPPFTFLGATFMVILCAMIFGHPAFAGQGTEARLFVERAGQSEEYASEVLSGGELAGLLGAAKRFRLVDIAPALLSPGELMAGDRIDAELFPDVRFWLTIEEISTDISGVTGISGNLGADPGFFLFSVADGKLQGAVHSLLDNQEFGITYAAIRDRHVLVEVDPHRKDVLPDELGPLTVPDGPGPFGEQE